MSNKIIAWADKEREKLEGVGLSDDLVSIVEGVIKRTNNMGFVIERIIEWKKDVDEDHLGLGADLLDELIDLYLNKKKEDLL
jgi:hypothetical protein